MTFKPIDIEDALQAQLNEVTGLTASATPLPANFESNLPFALVTATGGIRKAKVIDSHMVSIDTYAASWSAAMQMADTIVETVIQLEANNVLTSTPVYSVEIQSLPYDNTDPNNPTTPRVTINALVSTRTN